MISISPNYLPMISGGLTPLPPVRVKPYTDSSTPEPPRLNIPFPTLRPRIMPMEQIIVPIEQIIVQLPLPLVRPHIH